jgi:hypothetical protein
MRLGLRQKLVLGGLAIVVVVSFVFTLLQLALARQSVEEDLQARAVFFAREVAASMATAVSSRAARGSSGRSDRSWASGGRVATRHRLPG